MSKNTLGDIKLSPLKENGKFVFINMEVRVNNKLNKGDYIKIFVDSYEQKGDKFYIKHVTPPTSKMVVRGSTPIISEHSIEFSNLDDLYAKVGDMYKNQFYFGKTEI
ncbi:MAG: hypothetical protein JST52_05815 [Bacteroidetes bacterium]|nr:hypothetical protein [Bacteroidota bacterium]MBS1740010.1 hypothetical protein [Bacteroidota bacterium]